MSALERVAENNNVEYAKKCLLEVRKMNGMGKRSWPDRMFLGSKHLIFFIEYKRRGEEVTPNQARLINQLRSMGFHVYVVDDSNVGRKIIDMEIESNGRCDPAPYM